MLGDRNISKILGSIFGKRHYIAFFNMYRNYPEFLEGMKRYLTTRGHYPCRMNVRTPTGIINPNLYTYHDMLTVNEIFCRLDYYADQDVKTIVDIGSNIGISALYFLTRNKISKCYLYEPDPRNLDKLRLNLVGLEQRYILDEKAVSDESGEFDFGIEPTGRYGGIGVQTGEKITVKCLNINDILGEILDKEGYVDILKIDTEGPEQRTVAAIRGEYLDRIARIYIEARPDSLLHPDRFWQKQYGGVCQLISKNRQQSGGT